MQVWQENDSVKKKPELQTAHSETCLHCAQLLKVGHNTQIFVVRSAYVLIGHSLANTQPLSIEIY